MGLSRIVVVSGMFALMLSGCAAAPGGNVATSEAPAPPSATAQPAAEVPLTCADLVGQAELDEALASASVASSIGAAAPQLTPIDLASGVAGGIRCVWLADSSVDRSPIVLGPPGVPWLDVEILPGAADLWTPYIGGDDPENAETSEYADVTGGHSCGDPGCKATAAIGDSWVSIMVHVPSQDVGFAGIASTADEVFAKLSPAATALFATVADASPAELAWPASPGRVADPAVDVCSSFLRGAALSGALGVMGSAEYTTYPEADSSSPVYSLRQAAWRETGFVSCQADAGDDASVSFTLMLDNAAIVNGLAAGVTSGSPLHLESLELQVSGETAVSNCVADQPDCDLWFTLGNDAIYVSVSSTNAKAVAEGILAQAR